MILIIVIDHFTILIVGTINGAIIYWQMIIWENVRINNQNLRIERH